MWESSGKGEGGTRSGRSVRSLQDPFPPQPKGSTSIKRRHLLGEPRGKEKNRQPPKKLGGGNRNRRDQRIGEETARTKKGESSTSPSQGARRSSGDEEVRRKRRAGFLRGRGGKPKESVQEGHHPRKDAGQSPFQLPQTAAKKERRKETALQKSRNRVVRVDVARERCRDSRGVSLNERATLREIHQGGQKENK